jgi:uncharacterized protein (DUF885 family)
MIADSYLALMTELAPAEAATNGIVGNRADSGMTDYSPEGAMGRANAATASMDALERVPSIDATDLATREVMTERLELEVSRYEAGEHLRDLNPVASPLQTMRDVFDIMPQYTAADWEAISERMAELPGAVDSYLDSLSVGIALDLMPAARQVRLAADSAAQLARPGSFVDKFTQQARLGRGAVLPASLAADLALRAAAARGAFGKAERFFRETLGPKAPIADAVGRERYEVALRYFLGAKVDPVEAYEWGLEELERIVAEQKSLAERMYGPGTTVEQALQLLDEDEIYTLIGTDALERWINEVAMTAIEELADTHFYIPEPVRALRGAIAPTNSGGIYYTAPAEDFSRPGRMWWSVPQGVNRFHTWRERTTVYHEGVPGHHLQIATAFACLDLNRLRRLWIWVSGHGEGWALYAEELMDSLGYLTTLGERMGMLDGQRFRAARVVLDIGLHLGLPRPERWGGGQWDAETGMEFLAANVRMNEPSLQFEMNRYLGWPGQAPSYKLGQRLWQEIRDDAEARARAAHEEFSLKDFHMKALNLGSMGLDALRKAMTGGFDA